MNIEFYKFEDGNNWVSGLVNDGEFHFESKLFNEGSRFGINEGRVSKLSVSYGDKWRGFDNCFVNFDRGWDIKPSSYKEMEVFEAVLDFLENAPMIIF